MALIWGADGILIYNDAYRAVTAIGADCLIGKKVLDCYAHSASFQTHVHSSVFDHGKTLSYKHVEVSLYRGGEYIPAWLSLDYSPVIGASGQRLGILVIVADTTEQVLANRRDIAERDRLRQMFEQAPGFMLMVEGSDLICTLVNSAFMSIIGPRKIIGEPFRAAVPEIEGQGFFELLDGCFATGEPYFARGAEVRLKHFPSDELNTRFVDFIFQPIVDEVGAVTGIFIEGSDVTSQVEASAALHESEERFREAANAAPVLIWISNSQEQAIWVNREYSEFTGKPLNEIVGHGWHDVIHPDDLTRCTKVLSDHLKNRQRLTVDFRMRRHDGAWRHMSSVGVPRVSATGELLGFIGTCLDVTEARLIEDELRLFTERLEARVEERTIALAEANDQLRKQIAERERVEETLRQLQRLDAVGQLTAGVAHDFNNLLTIVAGNLEFLERDLTRANITGKPRERLSFMKAATDRGAKLTGQLLAFARKQRLESKPTNLNSVISGMRSLLQSSIGGSYRLEIVLAPDLWTAMVDITQIELMILNLAINGRDAMEVGGLLTVSTANVVLGPQTRPDAPLAGEYVSVSVSDTGTGMSPDVLSHAYEPFFTTKAVGKGSGLGLPQVFGFAKQSGGGIRIDTQIGVGTVVNVYFPRSAEVALPEPPEMPASAVLPIDGRARRILLVDDDDAVRSISALMIRELGCHVTEAASGKEALALLKGGESYDLAVLDFAMPGMNGAEVAREAAKLAPQMPVLFVTGYADISALTQWSEDLIIQKPFRQGELTSKIRRVLGGSLDANAAPSTANPRRA